MKPRLDIEVESQGGPVAKSAAERRRTRSVDILVLLLMVVFTTELAVMEIFAPLLRQIGRFGAAIVDATMLVVISTVPLWIVFSPVFVGNRRGDEAARRALFSAYCRLVAGFFAIELLVMLFLPGALSPEATLQFNLVDAGLTTLLVTPLIWWLLDRLGREHHRITLADLLESPQLLYLLLIYVVFLSALLQELIFTDTLPLVQQSPVHIVEAVLMTLIISPFLWLFVARPLRRSIQSERARARAVYEQVIDAVVLTDNQERIVAMNPAAQRIFGYAETELVGQPVKVLFADQRLDLEPLLTTAADEHVVDAGLSRERIGLRNQGGPLTMDVSVSRILLGGREDYLLILRDISERKEAERALRESDLRFREIYEQSADAILFFKPASDYLIEANATTEQLFGYHKDEMRGQWLEHLFAKPHLARVQQLVITIRSGENVQLDNLVARHCNGSERIVTLRAKIITLQGVDVVYCTLRDVTDRVRLEQEAREIQARLIQANKMTSLGLLVSGVAHEINNPNNYIMNNAQLMAGSWEDCRKILRAYYRENGDFLLGGIPFPEFDAQSLPLIEGILDGSRRIDQIIGTLKQFARPAASHIEGYVDINQIVSSAIAILRHELANHTEHFRCDLVDGLPQVKGDGQQLGQVVINLLMNACQALPSRSHGICLTTAFEPAAGAVTITVQDEGCGIPLEDRSQIMEPFFTTKLDRGGTGLGLSICRTIVAEHRGELTFVSTPGQGSTFTVSIPAELQPGEGGRQ